MRRLTGVPILVLKNVLAAFLAILTFAFALDAEPSLALEAPRVFRGVLVLEGRIIFGDYNRLRNFLSDKAAFDKISNGVFLASPGGNLGEAVRIGRLIRALQLSTTAPSGPPEGRKLGEALIGPYDLRNPRMNYQCASACFLIFVAGIYRSLNWAGRLGVHRPFQMSADAKKPGGDEELVDGPIRKAIENYLREMGVRIKYVDLMYSVPSSELRQITQDELDADLLGFTPDLKDLIGAKCGSPTRAGFSDNEKTGSTAAKSANDIAACRAQLQAQLRSELPHKGWQKVFAGK